MSQNLPVSIRLSKIKIYESTNGWKYQKDRYDSEDDQEGHPELAIAHRDFSSKLPGSHATCRVLVMPGARTFTRSHWLCG